MCGSKLRNTQTEATKELEKENNLGTDGED